MAKKRGRKKILRVGLIQNQKILEERLFRSPQTVTIGHDLKKNTLVVPASKLPRTFSVLEWTGDGYVLQFTSKMEGRVSRQGSVETLEELRRKGVAKEAGDGVYQLRLTPSTRGRVSIGEATVLFQFVTPPPEKARPVLPSSMKGGVMNGVERPLAVLVVISALIQVGFVAYAVLQDWPVPRDHAERQQERWAEIMDDDDQEEDEQDLQEDEDGLEELEDEEDELEEQEDEIEEDDTPDEPDEADEQPEEAPPEDEVTAEERVQDETVLGVLAADGDDESSVDAVAARGRDIETDIGGESRVETGGIGDDRITGGSPDADGAVAGGEDMDQIGDGDGVDVGDRDEEQVETFTADMPTGDQLDGAGTLDRNELMQRLNRIRSNVENCYQRHLRQDPNAAGTVRVMITVTDVGGRGDVSSTQVVDDTVATDNSVGNCISREIENRIPRLPAPEDGDAHVTVPYHFSPGG